MPRIELVVTDLDGTLWPREGSAAPETLDAWRTIEARGIPILVATGRRVTTTRAPLARLGLEPPAVVLDGALGLNLRDDERFHRRPMSTENAVAALERIIAHGLSPVVHVDHPEIDAFVGPETSAHPTYLASYGGRVATSDLNAVVRAETVLAFALIGLPMAGLRAIADALDDEGVATASLNRSFDLGGGTLTVVDSGVSKWDGIVAYCAATGLDSTRVLAIGDGPNDVEMLDHAAVALAPEGSSPAARAAADRTVGSPASGGWAEILAFV